jgi:hypothetical protein
LKSFCRVVILSFFLSCLPSLLFADQAFTISGVVHDVSGARVSHAHIAVHEASSSVVLEAETGDQGEFRIDAPAADSYKVEITADGFKPLTAETLLTDQTPTAKVDLTLEIAKHTETVEVTADALVAETTSTQLGETLETTKIESVPLNGRSFTDLMAVQPGIVPVNTAQPGAVIMTGVASTPPSGNANPGNLSISGQRESTNGFRVNGSDAEEDVNMGTSIVPNLDSIDSFRVLTSNFDAEYGNSSGGQVLVTTKSGTSQIHGSAFEFLRNTALDARNNFSQDRAAYRQNQFGGTVGGTPFHKSVALFADYQGTRLTEGIDTGQIAVPSVAERGGDFSALASSLTTTATLNGNQYTVPTTVSGPYLARQVLSPQLGYTVTQGEPYYFVAGESVAGNPASANSANCTSSADCVFPNASFHYELPTLKNARQFNWLASGWALAGITRFTSGLPVTFLNNNDTSLLGTIPNGINNNGVDTPNWSRKSLSLNRNPRGGRPVFDAT